MALSPTKQNALQKAQDCFQAANLHPSSQEFRLKCIDDQTFYDGTGQWTTRDLQTLAMREQLPITVNICKGYVDALSASRFSPTTERRAALTRTIQKTTS